MKSTFMTAFCSALLGIGALSLIAQQNPPESNDPAVIRRQQEIAAAHVPGSKTVRLARYQTEDPVRIIGLFEGDRDITATPPFRTTDGKPFVPAEGEEWIKDLKVVIQNVSNQEILSGFLVTSFPETGAGVIGDPVIADSVMFGQMPEHYSRLGKKIEPSPEEVPLNLQPGQEFTVLFQPKYEEIKAAVETKRPLTAITTCLVQLGYFYFANGIRWAPNNFQKPDPNVPGRYLQITPDEFRTTTRIN